jgi:hypothetical protein
MALTLTEELANEWVTLDAELRQSSFFDYLPSTLAVWGAENENGWVMSIHKNVECLPLWSHEVLAKKWLATYHLTANPSEISLHTLKTHWLPGLQKNNVHIMVGASPVLNEAVVMSAQEFSDALS